MIEQSEMLKTQLPGGIGQKRAELRQIRARPGGFNEMVAEPPHRTCPPRIDSQAGAQHHLLFTEHAVFFGKRLPTNEYI
jgi:hypothetical protein